MGGAGANPLRRGGKIDESFTDYRVAGGNARSTMTGTAP